MRFTGAGVAEFKRRLALAVADRENRGTLWYVHGAGDDPALLVDLEDYVEDFDTTLGYRRWLWRYRTYRALAVQARDRVESTVGVQPAPPTPRTRASDPTK